MKPRILICGQKPKRLQEFEDAYGSDARLAFHEKDTNVRRLADQARGAHVAFVCVNAAGHDVIRVLKRVGTPIEYINGAASELHAAIRDWLNKWQGIPLTTNGRAS